MKKQHWLLQMQGQLETPCGWADRKVLGVESGQERMKDILCHTGSSVSLSVPPF